jgi:hypothetical protein
MSLEGNAIVPDGSGSRAAAARAGSMGKRDMSGDLRGVGDPISKMGNSIVSTNADLRQRHAVIRGGRQDDTSNAEETPGDTVELTTPQPAPSDTTAEQPVTDSSRAAVDLLQSRGTVV